MMKVVAVVDKVDTALDRLAKQVIPYHDNIEYIVCDVHPKKADPEQLAKFEAAAKDADIIDYQYFRTAEMLREKYDWLKAKKSILTHNNPYSYKEDKWEWADINVGNNLEITNGLDKQGSPNIHHIPITIDPHFWKYNTEWKPNRTVIMVANRIESKKGILPVATAVGNLGLKFVLVGAVSDVNYMNDIMQTGTVEFYEQVSDEKLRELYYNSCLHVCNSVDNFESGTMPILEAMCCGVPVLSREVGHVPDIKNDDNIFISKNDVDDVYLIQKQIENIINDKKKLESVRAAAWNSAKNFNSERRAYLYQKLYRQLQSPQEPVSVIVPIADKPEIVRQNLAAIANQSYSNLEVIVVDDGDESQQEYVAEFANTVNMPVKYINNSQGDYGLARARNKGIIASTGEIVVFCDQRMVMDWECISELVKNLARKQWVYGNKGGKKDFVENLSAIYRDDIIRAGMFCERIDSYGGTSQEVRVRTRLQGIKHEYIETAKATPTGKSSNRNRKRDEIIKMKNRLMIMGLDQ